MDPASFKVFDNYVALPAVEAFRIEYWALEEAKIRRQPPEKELSRRVALVVGGASGIGREVARLAAARGAHVFVADRNAEGAARVAAELATISVAGVYRARGRGYSQPRIDSRRCWARQRWPLAASTF